MFRQGDFLFVPVEEMPENLAVEKRVKGKVIVGYGEATGHHHSVADHAATMFTDGVERWLVLERDSVLDHQEHQPFTLPAGVYRVIQEETYHAGKIQRVRD